MSVSKPFDAATKHLFEADPMAWLRFLKLQGNAAELINVELSTITGDADCVVRVKNPNYLLHVEFQVSYDKHLGARIYFYNAGLFRKYGLPVKSVVILLRPQAERKKTPYGRVAYEGLVFDYRVVRIWQYPVAEFLNGPLVLLPFATAADLPADMPMDDVIDIVENIEGRIHVEASPNDGSDLRMTALLLLGLKFTPPQIAKIMKGVPGMRESSTYQMILDEGRAEGEQHSLLLIGGIRFGEPDARTRKAIEKIADPKRLDDLMVRLLKVESWRDLLKV